MGDVRLKAPYQRVKSAANALDEIRLLSDEEVIAALSAAAAEKDPYVSNVLTTEAQNRVTRYSAILATLTRPSSPPWWKASSRWVPWDGSPR